MPLVVLVVASSVSVRFGSRAAIGLSAFGFRPFNVSCQLVGKSFIFFRQTRQLIFLFQAFGWKLLNLYFEILIHAFDFLKKDKNGYVWESCEDVRSLHLTFQSKAFLQKKRIITQNGMLQHSTSEKPKKVEMNNKIHNLCLLLGFLTQDFSILLSTLFSYLKPNDKNFISRWDFVVKVKIDDSKVEVI